MDSIKITLILISTWLFASSLSAQDSSELFRQANMLYQQEKYEQALDKYRQILELGLESGELYFNMGNACYRLEQLGKARLYYERAAKFLPADEALKENLRLLNLRLVDQIDKPPRLFLAVWLDALLNLFNIQMLSILTIALFWMVLVTWSLRLYYSRRRVGDRYRSIFSGLLVLFLIVVIIFGMKIYRAESESYGVIMTPSITLYAEPKSNSTEVFVLHEGTRVSILRQNDNWLEIRLDDGKTGWLESKYLEFI